MTQWYLSYEGKKIGPLDDSQAIFQVRMNQNGFAWREGFAEWLPISQVPELGGTPKPTDTPPAPSSPPPPTIKPIHAPAAAPPSSSSSTTPKPRYSDEIDFKIFGAEMQFVEIELDPGESAVSEAGAMMYKESSVQMETIFGDGSNTSASQGFLSKLLGAGKRLITGESLFMTVFTHTGQGKAHVAFGAPYPGNIIPVSLSTVGGSLICQKDSFLCAAKGVSIELHFQRKILTGLFGGEGLSCRDWKGTAWSLCTQGVRLWSGNWDPGRYFMWTQAVWSDSSRLWTLIFNRQEGSKACCSEVRDFSLPPCKDPVRYGSNLSPFPDWQAECYKQRPSLGAAKRKVQCWGDWVDG